MLSNQGSILKALGTFLGFFQHGFIRAFCKIPPDEDLADFGPRGYARPMANVPILVPGFPGAIDSDELLAHLGKQADRGLNWAAGSGFQPQDVLKFLGTLPKRVTTASFPRPLGKAGLIQELFPGFIYVEGSKTRGVYAQLAEQAKAGTVTNKGWWLLAHDVDKTALLERAIAIALDVRSREEVRGISVALGLRAALPGGSQTVPGGDIWNMIVSGANSLSTEAVSNLLTNRLEANLEPKARGVKDDAYKNARSPLGVHGQDLVNDLNRRRYTELANRVGAWLRTFFTVRLQDAVAVSVHARIEAYLAQPIKFGGTDVAGYFDRPDFDGDWADDNPEDDEMSVSVEEHGAPVGNPDDE